MAAFRFSSQILAFQSLPRSCEVAAVGSGSPILGADRDNFGNSSQAVGRIGIAM
jgi:hypothetical protein